MFMTCECGSVYEVGKLGEGMYRVDSKLRGYCTVERKIADQRPATIRESALTIAFDELRSIADDVVNHFRS